MRFRQPVVCHAPRPAGRVLRLGVGVALLLAVLAGVTERPHPVVASADDVAAPYRMIVYLDIVFPDVRGTCSGFLVGPHTIATAGHCVYNREHGGWATTIAVTPGVDGVVAPFARQITRSFSVAPEYLDTGDPIFDYGAITLDSDVLGVATGQFELAPESDRQLRAGAFATAGYGTSVTRATQWRMRSPRPLLQFDDRLLVYEWGTVAGMSGAPIFAEVDGAYRAFGIVIGENTSALARRVEVGVRANDRMLAFYREAALRPMPGQPDPPVGVAFRTPPGSTILVRSTSSVARLAPVVLQNSQDRVRWKTVASGMTDASGESAFQIEPMQTMYYRFVAFGVGPGPIAQGVVSAPDASLVIAASYATGGTFVVVDAAGRDAGAPAVITLGTFVEPPVFRSPGSHATADAVFTGGSLAQLAVATAEAGGSAAWLQDADGGWHLYVVGGPAIVNEDARRAFAAGVPASTPVGLVAE